jgi:periplasmic divalent cation tolerance protein
MKHDHSIITATFPDKDSAKATAKLLVEKRLAACIQLLPIESVYSWQGEICDECEVMLFIKSRTELFGEIKNLIQANHTYEVPEIVQIPIIDGLPEYLRWIDNCTTTKES